MRRYFVLFKDVFRLGDELGKSHNFLSINAFKVQDVDSEIIGVKSSNVLRINSRCTWRHRESSRNVDNTAIRHARSPLRPCGSVTVDVHRCPRGVAPLRHDTASRDTLVTAHGRRNEPSASHSSRCDTRLPILFSPPSRGLATTGSSSKAIDMTEY